MVYCKFTLITTRFATIVKNTSLIRFWNGPPDRLGLCMDVDLSVIRIFSSGLNCNELLWHSPVVVPLVLARFLR